MITVRYLLIGWKHLYFVDDVDVDFPAFSIKIISTHIFQFNKVFSFDLWSNHVHGSLDRRHRVFQVLHIQCPKKLLLLDTSFHLFGKSLDLVIMKYRIILNLLILMKHINTFVSEYNVNIVYLHYHLGMHLFDLLVAQRKS